MKNINIINEHSSTHTGQIPIVLRNLKFSGIQAQSLCESKDPEGCPCLALYQLGASLVRAYEVFPLLQFSSINTDLLNKEIKSVTFGVINGIEFKSAKSTKGKKVEYQLALYFNTADNCNILLPLSLAYAPIFRMFLRFPNLVVTKNGELIFYTSEEIYVTRDMKDGLFLTIYEIDTCIKEIDSVSINEKGDPQLSYVDYNNNHKLYKKFNVNLDEDIQGIYWPM